ncbi:hypothetical protein QR680_008885 [Steinernema hermaphroditum]|uniref:Uncharacterized protein n=1 Tax=Steinernema hermaphroditum TaxID=289476 RepID=A0AA39M8G7_9BILA|nr:hypothetical protein QR680_008885 [Steinernema hermaphroditum]
MDTFLAVRIVAKPIVLLCSLVISVSSLVVYVRLHRKRLLSTLSLYICSCIHHNILYTVHYVCYFIAIHIGPVPYFAMGPHWQEILQKIPPILVFVASTALGLDRLLAIAVPLKHLKHNLPKTLCWAVLLLSATLNTTIILSKVFLPQKVTNKLIDFVNTVTDIGLTVEIVLHLVFCILFYRFSRTQQEAKKRADRINQITVFQAISQAILWWIPLFAMDINTWFFDDDYRRIAVFDKFYVFSYDVNIIIVCSFIMYRLRPAKNRTTSRVLTVASSRTW